MIFLCDDDRIEVNDELEHMKIGIIHLAKSLKVRNNQNYLEIYHFLSHLNFQYRLGGRFVSSHFIP